MSWLIYNNTTGYIALFTDQPPGAPVAFVGPPVGRWPAHNKTTSDSKGAWPPGNYRWSHYNAHAEAGFGPGCSPTSYGCFGIHVFAVSGRPGIGVHAGRTVGEPNKLGGKTLGCIRVPANAMQAINDLHNRDPLKQITVA